jgi:hypothetical protein
MVSVSEKKIKKSKKKPWLLQIFFVRSSIMREKTTNKKGVL